jgi:hypothetical protein
MRSCCSADEKGRSDESLQLAIALQNSSSFLPGNLLGAIGITGKRIFIVA